MPAISLSAIAIGSPTAFDSGLNIGGLVLCVDADGQRLSPGGGERALLPPELVEERTGRWRPGRPEQERHGVTGVRRERMLLATHVSQREVGRRIALIEPRRTVGAAPMSREPVTGFLDAAWAVTNGSARTWSLFSVTRIR